MNSPHFIIGFFTGLTIVVVIALAAYFIKKKNGIPMKYDERQELLRGKAYTYAFWVLVAYLCLNGFLQIGVGIEWADLITSSFIGICLAITVFVVACIKNDAYLPFNEKPKTYYALFGLILAFNLVIGTINMLLNKFQFITDGKLNFRSLSFIVSAMMLATIIALAIKTHSRKNIEGRSRI